MCAGKFISKKTARPQHVRAVNPGTLETACELGPDRSSFSTARIAPKKPLKITAPILSSDLFPFPYLLVPFPYLLAHQLRHQGLQPTR